MFENMGLGRMNGNKQGSSFGTTQFSHESLQAKCLRWSKDGYQTPENPLGDNLIMRGATYLGQHSHFLISR